jgi:hypothetical protein
LKLIGLAPPKTLGESLDRLVVRTVLKALDLYREEKKSVSEIDRED